MELSRYDDSWKDIWRRGRHAPRAERWKWDPYTWKSVLERIWVGDIEHLICPICNQEDVYFKYLAVYETEVHGKKQIHGERWVGCETCRVQIHDRARLPGWIKNPEWILGEDPNRLD